MTRTKSFENLRRQIDADPGRRAHVEEYKCAIADATALADALEQRDAVRSEASGEPRARNDMAIVHQRQADRYLDALESYVAELGGRLEVRAVFPGSTVTLVASSEETADARVEPVAESAT